MFSPDTKVVVTDAYSILHGEHYSHESRMATSLFKNLIFLNHLCFPRILSPMLVSGRWARLNHLFQVKRLRARETIICTGDRVRVGQGLQAATPRPGLLTPQNAKPIPHPAGSALLWQLALQERWISRRYLHRAHLC